MSGGAGVNGDAAGVLRGRVAGDRPVDVDEQRIAGPDGYADHVIVRRAVDRHREERSSLQHLDGTPSAGEPRRSHGNTFLARRSRNKHKSLLLLEDCCASSVGARTVGINA